MTNALTPKENSKKQGDNTKMPPKTSMITQRLWTDFGRPVGVTATIQLMWLKRFTGPQPSHLPQKLCSQKDNQNNPP